MSAAVQRGTLLTDVMVPMRDGMHLATDVYLPAEAGGSTRWPALLERTPYGKNKRSRSELNHGETRPRTRAEVAAVFTAAGYAVIFQDCRGRYGSQGEFTKYLSEADDGADTIRWLEQQGWFDGRVATMGLSYAAHTQLALACTGPASLVSMMLDCGGFSNAYQCGIRQGGAFELKQVTWAFNNARAAIKDDALARAAFDAEDLRAWFRAMPWQPGHSPLSAAPEYEQYLFEQWNAGVFSDFWRQAGIYALSRYDQVPDIAQLHMSSWYDAYVRSTLDNFTHLREQASAPGRVRLIMGPWLHGDRNITHSGDVEFGPAAAFDGNIASSWLEYRRDWLEYWLRGQDNAIAHQAPVRLFLMGGGSGKRNAEGRLEHGGRWIASTDWPLPGSRMVPYHLHADGVLREAASESAQARCSYQHDPRDPVPTMGGSLTSGAPLFEGGAFDQRDDERFFGSRPGDLPIAARADVLVFQTEPLLQDTAVIGPIKARLHVTSDAPDTDFTIKLIDVHPPSADYPRGYAMNLTDGIMRCRYRKSWERPEPMQAGEVIVIEVEAFATANLFRAGHRIRVDVASSNFPKFDVNRNTGAADASDRLWRIATNSVMVNRHHPSCIILPIAPADLA